MPDREPLVYVVVISYNGRRFMEGCFGTLCRTHYANFRLLLVDNGSTDDTVQLVRRQFPDVEILSLSPNVGYTRAANAGIRHAMKQGASYVVACNDDIEMLDARWLAVAVAAAEADPRIGLVGFEEATDAEARLPKEIAALPTDYAVGFALLLPTQLLRTIGLFDEGYSVFMDEDDLEVRIQQAGRQIRKLNVPFLHHGGGTAGRHSPHTGYLQMRSGLRFCLKNRGWLRTLARLLRMAEIACNPRPLTMNPRDDAHRRYRNRGNVLLNGWLLMKAVAWNVANLPATLRARQRDVAACQHARHALLETLQVQQANPLQPARSTPTHFEPQLAHLNG